MNNWTRDLAQVFLYHMEKLVLSLLYIPFFRKIADIKYENIKLYTSWNICSLVLFCLKKRISVCGLMMNVRSSISSHFESSQNWPWTSFGTHLLECKQTRLGLTLKDGKQTFVCTESILDAYQENHSTKINTSAARCLGIR